MGRDVFNHDLETAGTTQVAATCAADPYGVTVSGDYLTRCGGDVEREEPDHLVLSHVPTRDATVIVADDGAIG